jgi:hypothetical protein
MREPPEAFRQFFVEDVHGAAEAIREETSSALDTFAKSAEFRRLQEQSREAWRLLGIDPALPVVGRMRALAAVAGLPWQVAEELIFDEPPGAWFQSLRVRAAAAVRADQALPAADQALPAAAAALPAAAAAVLVDAEEIGRFAEIDPRTIRRKLEGVECEPGLRRRYRWDLVRPKLAAWTSNSRIHRLRLLKWPENPSQLKNPSKNPGRIRP